MKKLICKIMEVFTLRKRSVRRIAQGIERLDGLNATLTNLYLSGKACQSFLYGCRHVFNEMVANELVAAARICKKWILLGPRRNSRELEYTSALDRFADAVNAYHALG